MIDAHIHLDRYGEDIPRALEQIRTKGTRVLAVSMDIQSFEETRSAAEVEPLVIPAFGVHPWEAYRYASGLEVLAPYVAEARVFGEIGLDFHFVRDEARFAAQRAVFEFFLDAAEKNGRLINVHTKGAEAAVLESLGRRSLPAVIVHWYSGPLDLVDSYLDLGAYFTVGLEVLYSELIRSLAAHIPSDRLLTETDNPGAWEWLEGEPGFPDLIEKVEEVVADIRGVSRAELSAEVEQNFSRVLEAGSISLQPEA